MVAYIPLAQPGRTAHPSRDFLDGAHPSLLEEPELGPCHWWRGAEVGGAWGENELPAS